MMKHRRLLAFILSLCMILSLAPLNIVARAEEETIITEDLLVNELDGSQIDLDLTQSAMENTDLALEQETIDDSEMVKVFIVMEGESVIEENAAAVVSDDDTQQKVEQLEEAQAEVVAEIEQTVLEGETLEVDYYHTWLMNGVSATVPYGTISDIMAIEGVSNVFLQKVYSVCETEDSVATPNTITDGVMIGRESAWSAGYTGQGMKIAVIDTGLDTDHQNFAALSEEVLTEDSATADTVAAVLSELNASARHEGLTVDDVYYSTKVVYGFNYCDNDLDITHADGRGDHGTHVAGIAAANKVDQSEVVGVAPDAQLYIMKVFGKNGGAYSADIVAALEDALKLGADVINMSLGSPAGFTSGDALSDGRLLDDIYGNVASTGTVLSVSAGNNYDSGYANNWGTDANLTENPDNGVVGSPGTYTNTMTVASVENLMVQRNYIDADGYYMGYIDSSDYGLPALTTLTGEYNIVVVPGFGEETDFEGLDLTGKVALVQRGGGINFSDKHARAEKAGAIATLIYNNTAGEFGADMSNTVATTPCACITMADGAYLVAALEENPDLTITFPTDITGIPNETAYEISDFSSSGPAPDLSLAPDIAAPGGYIYSTVDDGQYDLMSGTSMAAPNVAGMSALVLQYVKAAYPEMGDAEARAFAQDLLMSTSIPLPYDESGIAFSPRSQGSGLANVFNAVTTRAYLTVDGAEVPKAELGDDAEKTGAYGYSFNVHNFGDTAAYYDLDTSAQTEGTAEYYEGIYFMSNSPVALDAATTENSDAMVLTHDVDNDGDTDSHDAYYIYCTSIGAPKIEGWENESFRYDVDADEAVAAADVQAYLDALVGNESAADLEDTVLKVAAGETAVVNVNVTLADTDKAYLDTYYTNGGYVEGFTTLTARHAEGIDLSLPYLGFYGDWAEAPVLDNGSYWNMEIDEEGNMYTVGNQYPHILFSEFMGDDYGIYPGMNPYITEAIDPAHISLSPNGDGYMDTITDIYVSLMRNASYLSMSFTNMETEEVYFDLGGANVSKSVYMSGYGQIVPFVYTMYVADPLYNWEGLENNDKVLFEAEVIGVNDDEAETWSVPITVDLEAPELLSAVRTEDTEAGTTTLELTFRDNLSAAAIILTDMSGSTLYAMEGVEDVEPDENGYQNYTKTYDITDITGKLMIILSDYAVNENYYAINLGGEGTPYGDLVAYQYDFNTGVNGWVSFDAAVQQDETTIFTSYDMDFVAAEYVNGYVFAQTESGALYGFKYADMLLDTFDLESTYIAQLDNVYQDLAYSYAEGKLYGLFSYEDDGYPTAEIYSINLKGAYFDEDLWMDMTPYQEDWVLGRGGLFGLSMAIDDAGTIYVLGPNYDWDTESTTETAHLWSVGMEYDEWSDSYMLGYALAEIGDTGLAMDYLQSMTWDHNAEKLYWARFAVDGYTPVSELYMIDPTVKDQVTVEQTQEVVNEETGETTTETVEVTVEYVHTEQVGTLSGETCALFAPLTEESAEKAEHANLPKMDPSVPGTPILRDEVVTMNVAGTKTLAYDLDPWYTDHKAVVWSSSDESVVTVDENGTIHCLSAGSATITVANAIDDTLSDTVTVEVTALDLTIEGVISAQEAGLGNATGVSTYEFEMVEGLASFGTVYQITAPEELNYGLSLATSTMGRGSIWACEYGNTGMIYEIDPATGVVVDALEPIDGDMLFGMTYNEELDTFTGIMNMNLYVDLELTREETDKIQASYDEELYEFTYHKINMLPYLEESNTGFVTGETGQGASSEIVFCAITTIEGGTEQYMYMDYMGGYGPEITYTPDQTLVLMDNVGRLWFIDEVTGMTAETTEYGTTYTSANGTITTEFHGVEAMADANGTYSVFVIRDLAETPLTNMFRDGTMPRITYHFSDIEFAGFTVDGAPMITMSLYDYWNNGTTNELYLYIPGVGTGEYTYDENWNYVEIKTPDRLYTLGNTGENNIIASIHSASVTGGVDPEVGQTETPADEVNTLAIGTYTEKTSN